jgi:hypothetical protein
VDPRFDRGLLDVLQQANHHVTTALNHPKDGELLGFERAASALALESSAPSTPPVFATCSGVPLRPARR